MSSSHDATIKLWDIEKKSLIRTVAGHKGPINLIYLTKDEKTLLTGSWDRTIRKWDFTTLKTFQSIEGKEQINKSALCSPDGQYIAVFHGESMNLYSLLKKEIHSSFFDIKSSVTSMCFSKNSKYLYFASMLDITCIDIKEKKIIDKKTADGRVRKILLTKDGLRLISGSEDHKINIWNLQNQKLEFTSNDLGFKVVLIELSSDEKYLAIGLVQGTVLLWDFVKREQIKELKVSNYYIKYLAFSKDNNYLKARDVGEDEKIWSIEEQKEVEEKEKVADLFKKEVELKTLAETVLAPLTGAREETTLDNLLKSSYFKEFLRNYLEKPDWVPVGEGFSAYDPEDELQQQSLTKIKEFCNSL